MRHFRMTRLLLILIVFPCARQAFGQSAGALGPATSASKTHWAAPEAAQIKADSEDAARAAKVRIGLRLTPFKKVITRLPNGKADTRYIPGEALRHTLRARLNATNHFYVGDWHVETVPLSWVRQTQHYSVKINLYRRYGDFGQLEETVGTTQIDGVLAAQEGQVKVLVGIGRQRLRDKFGNPFVDVVAGFQPGASESPTLTIDAPQAAKTPTELPPERGGVPTRF